jgi:ribose transport system ATP-binding protein
MSDASARTASLTLGAPPLVQVRGASKRFGATQALAGVDLDVHPGSVLALLGQNGAGKSTVIKVLAGVYTLDAGEVTICGAPLGSEVASRSISFIHQDLGLVDGLSVGENVALGTGYPRTAGPFIGWRTVRERAARALELVGSEVDPSARVADLSRTEKSLVAIGRALVVDAKVLVLDEPTASLPVDETYRLFRVLRRLRDEGLGLVYVSHRLDEVFEIADHVTVMRDGAVVADAPIAELTPSAVVEHIVGRTPVPPPPPVARRADEAVLVLDQVVGQRVGPVSLRVGAGEVVGLVGLAGAGHVELGRTVLGDLPTFSGSMSLRGGPFAPSSVREAVREGLGFVTSNRADEGLAMALTLTENLRPNPALQHHGPFTLRRHARERTDARQLIDTFGVRPSDPDLPVSALSGGNQQKVILGRWLSTDASVLVLEEPTAGVDVGAKHELYTLLDEALERGVAVLLISTDFEEVASVSHRAVVFKDGRIVREIPRDELSVAALVENASGAVA